MGILTDFRAALATMVGWPRGGGDWAAPFVDLLQKLDTEVVHLDADKAPSDHTHGTGLAAGSPVSLVGQASAPATGYNSLSIYSARGSGGYLELFARAEDNGVATQLTSQGVGRLRSYVPGYVAGLQQQYSDATHILIRAGAVEIGGVLYTLPEDITITATTSSALEWRVVEVYPPAGGTTLTSVCFNTYSPASYTIARLIGGYYMSGSPTPRRIIGLYPTIGGNVWPYYSRGGRYVTGLLTVDMTTPPTSPTTTNIGLPANFPEPVAGEFTVTAQATAGSQLHFICAGATRCGVRGALSSTPIGGTWQTTIASPNGSSDLYLLLTSGGTVNLLQMTLQGLIIPNTLAR